MFAITTHGTGIGSGTVTQATPLWSGDVITH